MIMNKTKFLHGTQARTTTNRYGVSRGKHSLGLHYGKQSLYIFPNAMYKNFGKSVRPIFNVAG